MQIAIRMDDITPDMDWEKFNRFKAICDKYDVKPLIGVVPDNKDPNLHKCDEREDFWTYIKQLQEEGWVIAQHGVNHVYKTKKKGLFPMNSLSELAGLSYKEQYESLKKGKDILESNGIHTDFYMAPAHSFDNNTLKALKSLGFKKITDGFGDRPYEYKGMVYYPISFKQSKSLQQTSGYTTFVVHANTMKDKEFERYENMLEKYNGAHMDKSCHFISYSDYLLQDAEKRNALGRMKEYIMAMFKFILVRLINIK